MPRTVAMPQLSDGQAQYIVQRLVSEGRISPAEVSGYIGNVDDEIRNLEAKLARLRAIRGVGAWGENGGTRRRGRPRKDKAAQVSTSTDTPKGGRRRRRRITLTPEVLASRKLQGRYLALIRQIPVTRRGVYSKVAKEQGREAAIAQMEKTLGK